MLFTVVLVSAASSEMLASFDELMDSLKKGNEVRMVVDYGKCDLYVDGEKVEKSPEAVGGMPIDVFEYFAPGLFGNEQGFLAFSHNSFINIRERYRYNYVKVKVYDDGVVEINARYLVPGSNETVMNETFKTVISDGKKGAASFFE